MPASIGIAIYSDNGDVIVSARQVGTASFEAMPPPEAMAEWLASRALEPR